MLEDLLGDRERETGTPELSMVPRLAEFPCSSLTYPGAKAMHSVTRSPELSSGEGGRWPVWRLGCAGKKEEEVREDLQCPLASRMDEGVHLSVFLEFP